jgi:hypothetical protein
MLNLYIKKRHHQRGSVFTALFGAVVMVGVVAAGVNTVMRGPVTTMSEVTRRTVAENAMIAASRNHRLLLMQDLAGAGPRNHRLLHV